MCVCAGVGGETLNWHFWGCIGRGGGTFHCHLGGGG